MLICKLHCTCRSYRNNNNITIVILCVVDAMLTNSEDGAGNDAAESENVVSISLPPSLFELASDDDSDVGLAFTFYESPNLFPLANGTRSSGVVVGSSVIGALVAGKTEVVDLEEPVRITLILLQDVRSDY